MARYTGPKCRSCRREGTSSSSRATTCLTRKCKLDVAPRPARREERRRMSDYGMQLREKQKMRRIYGVLERQFRNYFDEGRSRRRASPARRCCRLLESRLDNVVYRMGFGASRAEARQIVRTRRSW